MNDIKSTWKGIKSIITIKSFYSDIPKSLFCNGSTITIKVEFQISLTIILQQLLKKQKKISIRDLNTSLSS